MNLEQNNRQLIRVDIPKDLSLVAIIVFPLVMMLILMPLSVYCPACKILMYFIWYLSFAAIVLQDRTAIETTRNTIAINRFLFDKWIIKDRDILKIDIRKNTRHTYRILWYTIMVAILVNLGSSTYHGILNSNPTEASLYSILSGFILIAFFCSLFINMERRLRFPSVLEITTDTGKYKFYTHDPEEFQKTINRNLQES